MGGSFFYLQAAGHLVPIICFAEPNIDGQYAFSEEDYSEMLRLAPNTQSALESVDTIFAEARKELRRKIDNEKKRLAEELAKDAPPRQLGSSGV